MHSADELIKLSDPGEVGRAEHNRGDRAIVQVSNIFAWMFPALMLAIVAQVFLRSSGNNQAWMDDLQWWLYGSSALMAIGYAVTTNSHAHANSTDSDLYANPPGQCADSAGGLFRDSHAYP